MTNQSDFEKRLEATELLNRGYIQEEDIMFKLHNYTLVRYALDPKTPPGTTYVLKEVKVISTDSTEDWRNELDSRFNKIK